MAPYPETGCPTLIAYLATGWRLSAHQLHWNRRITIQTTIAIATIKSVQRVEGREHREHKEVLVSIGFLSEGQNP